MKQTIITLLCLLAFTSSQAQIEKGSNAITINAGLGFNRASDPNQSNNLFRINVQPVFEHFIARNLSLGAGINGGFQFGNDDYKVSPYSYKANSYAQTYGLSLQLKKYWFMNPQIGLTLSPQLSSTYYEYNNSTEYTTNTNTYNYNYWYHSAMLNFGAVYFVKSNIAIEAQTNFVNYSYYPGSPSYNNNERHVFSVLAFQSSLMVGVKFILGNNKPSLTP
ncbi:MAG: hypothetical protein V4538_07910 [Bacteroidota bacterium]